MKLVACLVIFAIIFLQPVEKSEAKPTNKIDPQYDSHYSIESNTILKRGRRNRRRSTTTSTPSTTTTSGLFGDRFDHRTIDNCFMVTVPQAQTLYVDNVCITVEYYEDKFVCL